MPDGHRWSGYSHEELYEKINAGPGPQASHASIERWEGVSAALAEINSELHAGVLRSGATWEGAAADQARTGMNPLAAWADDARGGAEIMRLSAELQADYIAKARADMPPPVKVTAEDPGLLLTGLTHLVGGQTDYEKQEKAHNAAEQRAREVMTTYASSTTSNVNTLGQFHQPPQLVVTTTEVVRNDQPGVGAPVFHGGGPRGGRGAGRGRGRHGGRVGRGWQPSQPAQPRPATQPGGATTNPSTSVGTTNPSSSTRPANSVPTGAPGHPALGPGGVVGGVAGGGVAGGRDRDRRKSSDTTTAEQHQGANAATDPLLGRGSGTTTISSAEFGALAATNAHHVAAGPGASPGGPLAAGQQGGNDTVHKRTVATPGPQQAFDPFGGLGRARAEEEEDGEHDGADYLRETDDIYGIGGTVSPPVIGESTLR
ncbi:PPE domain-containing protein [Saccharothrix australiensis]|uniref:PPE family protein n=1 Tax=Saccharothrix australiensis TaxID=2072 RepID=A0A495WA05_9PSEU|nr:PPE domain-containing protein [Saccharothrix australiensis]RKT57543.1 PPE family protein [Saccharothrix australiensis]